MPVAVTCGLWVTSVSKLPQKVGQKVSNLLFTPDCYEISDYPVSATIAVNNHVNDTAHDAVSAVFLLVLLLSGDVEVNPGPIKHVPVHDV